jgi:hypothetical protein
MVTDLVTVNGNQRMKQEPTDGTVFDKHGTRKEGLLSRSLPGTRRFTVRMPLPVTVHIVHSDVADRTVRRVLFLEDDRRVAGDLH